MQPQAAGEPPKPETAAPLQPKRKRLFKIIGLLLAITVLIAGSVYVFYYRPAQRAYAAYLKRQGQQTLQFDGGLEFYGQDFLQALDSKVSFVGMLDRRKSTDFVVNFSGSWARKYYAGRALAKNGELYFNMLGANLPVIRYRQSTFLLPLKPQWYRTKLDQSLFSDFCQNQTPTTAGRQLELYRAFKQTHNHPSWLVNFWSHASGYHTIHLSGDVDSRDLPALFSAAQAALPAGCDLNTLGFSASDTRNFAVHYDLWTGPQYDRLKLMVDDKVLGSRLTFTLNTHNFGQPVTITPPPESADLNQIFASAKVGNNK